MSLLSSRFFCRICHVGFLSSSLNLRFQEAYCYWSYSLTRGLQTHARVHEFQALLSKNSSNSNKPPGSEGLKKKTKSLRGKSGKKTGSSTRTCWKRPISSR